MSSPELERIAAAAGSLRINHRRGKYHKPVALVWAIDRAVQGLPRLVAASAVRTHLDPLLEELTGVESNAAWPWLKLANDLGPSSWVLDGTDPSGDPPAAFVAGWSRAAYQSLVESPADARRIIESVLDMYLEDVRDLVVSALGLEPAVPGDVDTVIVAASTAYDEYQTYSAYICQPKRSFRSVDQMGFYRDKQIEPLVPRVLYRQDQVLIDQSTADRLQASDDEEERSVGRLVHRLVDDGSPRVGSVQQIFLLSSPDSDETLDLGEPTSHDGPNAWTQGQRYTSSHLLRSARSTDEL